MFGISSNDVFDDEILLLSTEDSRYIDDLNEATKSILFITFLLNSIKVASVLFPLMAVKSLSALAFPAIFSSMLVAEVFYLGWICNEVKEQISIFADIDRDYKT
ncbi:hypothetical protein HUJ04_010940 [Dendroctonus ponderosae]|nr:hypothetical protein HUJ04_010940 [Dendroctonus ponderosae]